VIPVADRGLTHIALTVSSLAASIRFYADYAGFAVVHERHDHEDGGVVWISDLTRPFVIVLIEVATPTHPLAGFNHLGVGVASHDEVDRLAARAQAEGRLVMGPVDAGYPVGYWAFIADPDGHLLEVSFGQEVGLTVAGREPVDPAPS
jgi:catechol 2,3-dioxygenase-like lactoylglutathione lyase family enzyme